MTDNAKSILDAVPHRITNPGLIPVERYYDPAFHALEKERLWPFHGWRFNGEGENTFVFGRHFFDDVVLAV